MRIADRKVKVGTLSQIAIWEKRNAAPAKSFRTRGLHSDVVLATPHRRIVPTTHAMGRSKKAVKASESQLKLVNCR